MTRPLEATRAGRAAISVLVVAILAAVLLGSFRPDVAEPTLQKLGFQQWWGVYAPEPIRRSETLEAVITYTDGGTTTWRIPRASALFPYPSHRWERWQDSIIDGYQWRWERTARWIVREHAAPGRVATAVVLRRRWAVLSPPGSKKTRPTWNQADLITLRLFTL